MAWPQLSPIHLAELLVKMCHIELSNSQHQGHKNLFVVDATIWLLHLSTLHKLWTVLASSTISRGGMACSVNCCILWLMYSPLTLHRTSSILCHPWGRHDMLCWLLQPFIASSAIAGWLWCLLTSCVLGVVQSGKTVLWSVWFLFPLIASSANAPHITFPSCNHSSYCLYIPCPQVSMITPLCY